MKNVKALLESICQPKIEESKLDELSKKTLGSYVKKAHQEVIDSATGQSFRSGQRGDSYNTADETPHEKKRQKGIDAAMSKLTREDLEESQLDELSKKTLGSYIKKASSQEFFRGMKAGKSADDAVDQAVKSSKRVKGIAKATDKLSEEDPCWKGYEQFGMKEKNGKKVPNCIKKEGEGQMSSFRELVEAQLDELSKKTLGSYIKKAHTSATNAAHSLGVKRANADDVDRFTNRSMNNGYEMGDQIKKAIGADGKSQEKDIYTGFKRRAGIARATDRLTREEDQTSFRAMVEAWGTKATPEQKKAHMDNLRKHVDAAEKKAKELGK